MKLGKIYDRAVKEGMKVDPRSLNVIRKKLTDARKTYKRLSGFEQNLFDRQRLTNPYSDTRILYGSRNTEVRTILLGIDIGGAELLLADRLRRTGREIDLVLSHHPQGIALAGLHDVMGLQVDILKDYGLDRKIAEDLFNKRAKEVERTILAVNHNRHIDIARILDIPFMCIHTPADNHVTAYLKQLMKRKRPKLVREVIRILKNIPEYKRAASAGAGPKLIAGKEDNPVGKILIDMTGGTEGSKEVFARLSQAGVGTIIAMHLSEEHFKRAKPEHINVIIAGHISSDTIGLNLLLDKLCRQENLRIIPCSGFQRIKRT